MAVICNYLVYLFTCLLSVPYAWGPYWYCCFEIFTNQIIIAILHSDIPWSSIIVLSWSWWNPKLLPKSWLFLICLQVISVQKWPFTQERTLCGIDISQLLSQSSDLLFSLAGHSATRDLHILLFRDGTNKNPSSLNCFTKI